MQSGEVMVVGAGVIGASIAWHLASRGCSVRVVDRGHTFGEGSTGKATGGFRSQFGTEVNVRLSMLSREKLLRFEEEIGVDSGYRPYGYLFLIRTEEEFEELLEAQEVQHACGMTESRMIGRQEALELNPAIEDDSVRVAAFCATDGFIRPMQILSGYVEAARRVGVTFELGTEIRKLDPGVTYVNAAGAWAAEIAPVPVTPLRRRVACTVPTDVLPETMPMTIWSSDAFHVRVRDGRVMLVWPDDPPDDEKWMPEVLRRAHERIPLLRDVPIDPAQCWSGLYEMSPDRHAILGWHPSVPRLFLANGSSGHGVMHAPAIGQIAAEMILDGKASSIDVRALRPERFAEGEPISGPALL
jgi:sarcosine oxidase, subunit beta